ncbi:Hydrogenase-4 component E [Novipirellula aureliae]|uniref:Hydrogenase-4 component E n=1 Tax=Novipirellula aureliae TaxID=2527966 RepID=A0A5C6DCP1_9BACT|nr:hydrogenase [Novipirellula aureliae]TWU34540.1 Hydrogenase-4 component E [Novipirellula aureliae]
MSDLLDPGLVIALLLNFYALTTTNLKQMIYAVAMQGALLGMLYPIAHTGFLSHADAEPTSWFSGLRLMALTATIVLVKGFLIPRFLLRAARLADVRSQVTSTVGVMLPLLLGGVATVLALVFAKSLPLAPQHISHLPIPASLATVMCGFLILSSRREAMGQVLGYIVLENGIFIFGLLLIEAVPLLVELGIVLDLFVGVFVMGIIFNHVSRAFPEASVEHLSTLKE